MTQLKAGFVLKDMDSSIRSPLRPISLHLIGHSSIFLFGLSFGSFEYSMAVGKDSQILLVVSGLLDKCRFRTTHGP